MASTLWLRGATKHFEHRTPLVPADLERLVAAGHEVVVEASPERVFADEDFGRVGCRLVEPGSWPSAPAHAFVLGLKELPLAATPLTGKHLYFGHAFKGQTGARALLGRFAAGGGTLFDLEYLVDAQGRRVAAFGYWAGFMGAALGAAVYCHQRLAAAAPLPPVSAFPSRASVIEWVQQRFAAAGGRPRALVIGAKGRSGRGAVDLLEAAGAEVAQWDLEETRAGGPFAEALTFDLLVNCVLVTSPTPPFLTRELLQQERRLVAISDVSCDPTSPLNPLPIYDTSTTVQAPARALALGTQPLALTAIDHLPSLLPRESSEDFSHQLAPQVAELLAGGPLPPVWQGAEQGFPQHGVTVRPSAA